MTCRFESPDELAGAIVDSVGSTIVLGLPVGIGKAVHVADALFERARRDASIKLTIFTALTLEIPRPRSDFERRFLEPLVERLYGGYPEPVYARAVRENHLPDNVRVTEFYLRPGGYLDNATAQRGYTSLNYTQIAAELLRRGVNVIAQLVARRDGGPLLSLGSNPDLTLDLLPELERRRAAGRRIAFVGQLNRHMPYMFGDAELPAERFDFLLESPQTEFPLFALPNRRVTPPAYATGMHVASLVPDGGTVQLGIGSLSDAVAHCLRLRHRNPALFRRVLARLPGAPESGRRPASLPLYMEPFEQGLYAVTELLSDALLALFEADILRRPAGEGDERPMHAAFLIGSASFYERLRAMPEARRRLIDMTSISFVNSLHGDEHFKRRQRRQARLMNEAMMVTLLGAVVSDGLEDGRVVSGVGGQFDFIRMAHELDDARSIVMFNAARVHRGAASSNVRWQYAHTTVPRHYRDVFVNEFGLADTRGASDEHVIAALLDIADSRFQPALAGAARAAGKLPGAFSIPTGARRNTPEAVAAVFDARDVRPHFPPYPLGTDFTPVEQRLAEALTWLERHTARRASRWRTAAAALVNAPMTDDDDALARMGLARPAGLRERRASRMRAHALAATRRAAAPIEV